eukprot:2574733-Rhodomonas_salina.1
MVTSPRVVQDEAQGQWDARDPYFAGARSRNFLPASDFRTTTQILSGVSKAFHTGSSSLNRISTSVDGSESNRTSCCRFAFNLRLLCSYLAR